MKRRIKRILSLALGIVFALLPANVALAGSGDYHFNVLITYYGSEPTPITVYICEQQGANFYTITHTVVLDPIWYDMNSETYCYQANISVAAPPVDTKNLPFAAVSLDSVNGKWYVDKWDWNNWIYQPGAYMNHYDYASYEADFFLTSSAPTNNSITINRTWAGDAPPADTEYVLFKHYNQYDKNVVCKKITIPKDQTSVTVSGLYAGTYYITNLYKPSHYTDDATENFDCYYPSDYTISDSRSHITAYGRSAVLSGNTQASVNFVDFYPARNTISVAPLSGGTITPEKTKAIQGDPVGVTVSPDANKQLKAGSLQFTDTTGSYAIGGWFSMPNEPVTLSAEFEPKQYTVGVAALSGGTITPDKATAASGDTVNLTVTPAAGKQMRPGTLTYADGSGSHTVSGTSFEMPQSNVTVSAQFETPVSMASASLPDAMKGNAYSASVSAQNGWAPYTWSAYGLPAGLAIDSATGAITGTPTQSGTFQAELTATDMGGTQATKTLSLSVNDRCGNGAYLLTPETNPAYVRQYGSGGIPEMTISNGITGFRALSVAIKTENGHAGNEALLFVQFRKGAQIGISANYADYDTIPAAKAAFNVKPGDVIKVYIVDDLGSDSDVNPAIL